MRAIALYDFQGDNGNDEITFNAGDYITVLDDTGDDGWWVGRTLDGNTGIFPKLYVEKLDLDLNPALLYEASDDEHYIGQRKNSAPNILTNGNVRRNDSVDDRLQRNVSSASVWANELSDRLRSITVPHESAYSESFIVGSAPNDMPPLPHVPQASKSHQPSRAPTMGSESMVSREIMSRTSTLRGAPISSNALFSSACPDEALESMKTAESPGQLSIEVPTVIYSSHETPTAGIQHNKLPPKSFLKDPYGVEDFLLREITLFPDVGVKHFYLDHLHDNQSFRWANSQFNTQFNLSIAGFSKNERFFKTTILFHIQDSISQTLVERSFKNFEWLHIQLEKEFPLLCIYSLPEKDLALAGKAFDDISNKASLKEYQVSGAPFDNLLSIRSRQLERYLQYLASHPVLSQSETFKLFISVSDKNDWKIGKKHIEKILNVKNNGEKFFDKSCLIQKEQHAQLDKLEALKIELLANQEYVERFEEKTLMLIQSLIQMQHSSALVIAASASFKNLNMKLSQALLKQCGQSSMGEGWCWHGSDCNDCKELNQMAPEFSKKVAEIAVGFVQMQNQINIPILEYYHEFDLMVRQSKKLITVHQNLISKLRVAVKNAENSQLDEVALDHLFRRGKLVHAVISAECEELHSLISNQVTNLLKQYQDKFQCFYCSTVQKFQFANSNEVDTEVGR